MANVETKARIAIMAVIAAAATASAGADPHANLLKPHTVEQSLGVNVHSLEPSDQELRLLKDAGLVTLRTDFAWDSTEREPGRYDFSKPERFLDRVRAAGLAAIMALAYSNPIYGNDAKPPFTDRGRLAFAHWAAAAIHHFAGRGVIWEVWNEPNGKWFWPNPNARDYAALVHTVAHAVRANDPGEMLVGPALYGADINFLKACVDAGCLDEFDAVTVHPYRKDGPETAVDDLLRLRRLIETSSPDRALPLLQGEWGYPIKGESADRKRAILMLRVFLTGLAARVPVNIWYDWIDDGEAMGLVRHGPSHPSGTVEPESGYKAVKLLVQTFGSYHFDWPLKAGASGTDIALSFQNGQSRRFVAWTTSNTPRAVEVPLPNGRYEIIDSLAERPPIEATATAHVLRLQLTQAPVYVLPKAGS